MLDCPPFKSFHNSNANLKEFMQVSPSSSKVTKGHFSWYAFLNIWKPLLFAGEFCKCSINRLGHAFPWTRNIFTDGAPIPKIYSACSFTDAMFSSENFFFFFWARLSRMRRALPRANLHISIFHTRTKHPKVARLSSSTKASATLGEDQKGRVCLFSVFPERPTDFDDFPE